MYTPHKHKKEVKEHGDGAIEIRATLLVHGDDGQGNEVPKAIHVHVLDADAVVAKIAATDGLEKMGGGLKTLFGLLHTAAGNFSDAHKIEITAENVFGLLDSQDEAAAATKKKAAKKAARKKKPAASIAGKDLELPGGAKGAPEYPGKQ